MGRNDDAPDTLQMAVQLAQAVKSTATHGKYKSLIKRKFRMGKGAYQEGAIDVKEEKK